MSRFLMSLAAVAGLYAAASAGEPFAIDLEVRSGKASKTAHVESAAPALGEEPKARDLLEVKAGDRITVKWKMSSTDSKAKVEDVTVHFFAVKEEKAGQPKVPKLDESVVAETALTMDFGPEDKNESELSFTIDEPGVYLVRVETIGAAVGPPGHEDYAALDVKVR
jgi:hypothetical protein